MDTSYKEMQCPYSTADADDPSIKYENGNLEIAFRDWREKNICILFRETEMFSWSEIPKSFDLAPDRVYEAKGTSWLRSAQAREDGLRHYILCFNASSFYLQVLCEGGPVQR